MRLETVGLALIRNFATAARSGIPRTGNLPDNMREIDVIILDAMRKLGIPAGTLCISTDSQIMAPHGCAQYPRPMILDNTPIVPEFPTQNASLLLGLETVMHLRRQDVCVSARSRYKIYVKYEEMTSVTP